MKLKVVVFLFLFICFSSPAVAQWSAEGGPRPELPEDIQTRLSMSIGISYNLFTPHR